MSSDPNLDQRLLAVLDKHHARNDALEADLHNVLVSLEMEHYYGESCAGESWLRDQGKSAIARGETHTAKFYGTLADIWKKVREKRFPLLAQKLKSTLSS